MKGLDVFCAGCGKSFHSTTDKYNPDKAATGDMCELKEPWKGYGWAIYGDGETALDINAGQRASVPSALMECPGCCALMAPQGRLKVSDYTKQEPLVCEKCGKEYVDSPKGRGWFKKHVENCK